MWEPEMRGQRIEEEREKGQILVLFALVLVVILAFAAIAVDLGVLRNNRQILRNTTDAAALAGGTLMPVDGSAPGAADAVATLINSTIQTNYPDLPQSTTAIDSRCVVGVDPGIADCAYTISYRCLIGADSTGPLISRDVPATCDPRPSLGASNLASQFTGAGPTRTSSCTPSAGDKCNVVVVEGSSTTQYAFAPVVGIENGSSGTVASAACGGPCGAVPLTLNDVELVIDKSGSMNGNNSGSDPACPSGCPRIFWAKKAANQLVTDLANNGGIGATGNQVGITTFSGTTANSDATAWTSTAAQLATKINAIAASGNTPTALGMQTATADLIAHARNAVGGNVERVVIFLSDGRPNPDQGPNGLPATSAAGNQRPTQADITAYLGSADIAYSILIGTSPYYYSIGQGPYLDPNINDPAMMKLLATPDNPSAIPPETYYYNVVDASGLPSVFHQIASQILGSGAHLIQLYPSPVVTSVSPSSGTPAGGTPITISGQYFTGATSVTIGGAQATSVTVTSDGTITALTPPGAVGQADVIVTTPGGTSTITSAAQFTFN
jgi:IPT/TIG domain/von Willebrand factor type A domain/Putative Flp pilus-assembly TadE/G-like